MPLTDRAIQNFKPEDKQQKHFDGGGLHIVVSPAGGKHWRYAYRFRGKQKLLSIGPYPAVILKAAREKRDEAKGMLAKGIDPAEHKQEMKRFGAARAENSFAAVAKEWHLKYRDTWTKKHAADIWHRIDKNVLEQMGHMPIADIKPFELLTVLRRVEARGALEQAHRVLQICGSVFRYAVATGRAERDITADLKGAIPPKRVKHHASLTEPRQVGQLLRAIDGYEGGTIVSCALRLSPLVFVRPGELRFAQWSEFDLDGAEWRIPAERMKMGEKHIVSLATQAIAILRELYKASGHCKYLFPSVRADSRPMSDNTVNAALRRLGYTRDEMTGHGFRSMASTLLNELGWNRDAIERQLAHGERNRIRAAYNFAEFLPERRRMMQAWADYLDQLRNATTGSAAAPVEETAAV